jgi:hypothetical protein
MRQTEFQRIEKAIHHCQRHVERARAEVERRERRGMDAGHARSMMTTFVRLRAEYASERNRLREERGSEPVGGTAGETGSR